MVIWLLDSDLTLAIAILQVTALAGPYVYFLVPPKVGGGSGGTVAKDALGNDIKVGFGE